MRFTYGQDLAFNRCWKTRHRIIRAVKAAIAAALMLGSTAIRNIKKYMLAVLFNAPSTTAVQFEKFIEYML